MNQIPKVELETMRSVTEVHKNYCAKCPSNRNVFPEPDPESKDIASLPDGEKQMHVFPCAWRPNKLCKGVCEELDYNEAIHGQRLKERPIYG